MTAAPSRRPRLLIVRPQHSGTDHGGDEVCYRYTHRALEQDYDLEYFPVPRVGRWRQLAGCLRGAPLEVATYQSRQAHRALRQRLARGDIAAVCLLNEACASYQQAPLATDTPCLLLSHNTHSMVARTDPSLLGKAVLPFCIAYERRYFTDPRLKLFCISRLDARALRESGIVREDVIHLPPGAPPGHALAAAPDILHELVLFGSCDWWRKRRDLVHFAQHATTQTPIWATDARSRAILAEASQPVIAGRPDDGMIRFGLIADRFAGGFKLKSTEYIAENNVLLALCDIREEFAGLPDADVFVRHVRDPADIDRHIADVIALPDAVARFRVFKEATLARFAWDACLAPLLETLSGIVRQTRAAEAGPQG